MTQNEALIILGLNGEVSAADIKLAYKRKAKEYHPDLNPAGIEMMKVINAAYELVKNLENATIQEDAVINGYPSELSAAINEINTAKGLVIEICGLWVWVSGETSTHKGLLKGAGYKWAPKKKMWYFRPAKAFSKNRSGRTWEMDEIRASYGSSKPAHTDAKKIKAA